MDKLNLQTGDILLFDYEGNSSFFRLFSYLMEKATHSKYTHAGMILKDPTFIHPSLKGLYVWESGWEGTPDQEDGKVKLGVQLTSFHDIYNNYTGKLYVRRLKQGNELITNKLLDEIHQVIYNKPYDIVPTDWVGAITRKDSNSQKTDRFWCSALVTYILVQFGYLEKDTNWSLIRPSDLSSKGDYLKFLPCCKYDDDLCIN